MCSRVGWSVVMGRTDVVHRGFIGRRLRENGERLCVYFNPCFEEQWCASGIFDREVGVRQSRIVDVM